MNTLGRCLLLCLLWACSTKESTLVHVQVTNIPDGTQVVKTSITFHGLSVKTAQKDLTADLSRLTVELPGAGLLQVTAMAQDGGGQVLAQGAAESAISGPGEHEVKLVLQAKMMEEKPPAQVRVRWPGLGRGAVTSDPPGIDCAATAPCAASFPEGTQVKLTVRPESRSYFRRFGGACSGESCMVSAGTQGEVEVHLGARFCDELRPGQGAICIVDPPAGAPDLAAVWGTSGDDLWATGSYGVIVHYDGFTWTPVPDPSRRKGLLNGIWGSGPNDVYIVGDQKTILHWDGTEMNLERDPPAGGNLNGVGGVGKDEVWIAGEGGALLHRENGSWVLKNNTKDGQVQDNLRALWVNRKDDIWAAGEQSAMWRWTGTEWTKYPSPSNSILYALWGRGTNQVWAVGAHFSSQANIQMWDGRDWRLKLNGGPPATPYYRIWGRGQDEVFAIGDSGLRQWNGTSWNQESKVPSVLDHPAVWADENSVVVVHRDGIMRKRGRDDFVKEHGGQEQLHGVWAFSANEVWAVGDKGLLRRFDGSEWRAVTVPAKDVDLKPMIELSMIDLRAIWGRGPNDLWIVGKGGTILHVSEKGWKNLTDPNIGAVIESVYGIDDDNIWLVGANGSQGYIRRCRKNETCDKEAIVGDTLGGVWGSGVDNAWAVGANGAVLRLKGAGWEKQVLNPPLQNDLYAVSGSGPTRDVWMVGKDAMLRYRNGLLEQVSVPTDAKGRSFNEVYAASDSDVWIVSDDGILHLDAVTAQPQDWTYRASLSKSGIFYRGNLYGVHGIAGQIWAVGEYGVILHYPH